MRALLIKLFKSDYMIESNDLIINNSKVASTFFNLAMHQFIKRNKTRVAQGNCLVLQYQPQDNGCTHYYIKMNNYDHLKLVTNSLFFKMIYAKSTSYLFFDDRNNDVVYSISGMNNSVDLEIIEAFLRKQARVQDYSNNLEYEKKVRIDYHAQDITGNEIIVNFNKSSKIAQQIGSYFGKIQKFISLKTHQTQKIIQNKLQKISKQTFSEGTVGKWNNLKSTAGEFNEKLIDLFSPINSRIENVVNNIGEKYNTSTNQYIVTFRQFSKQTSNALNEAVRTENMDPQIKTQAQSNINFHANEPNELQRPSQQAIGTNPYPVLDETI